jgi:hypothetical protein
MAIDDNTIELGLGEFTLNELRILAVENGTSVEDEVMRSTRELIAALSGGFGSPEATFPDLVRTEAMPAHVLELELNLTADEIETIISESERQGCEPEELIRHGVLLALVPSVSNAGVVTPSRSGRT